MIQVSHHRRKCIGCNACVEVDAEHWRMSRRDGKSVLIGAKEKRHMYVINLNDDDEALVQKSAEVCPVNIIQVKKI